MSTDTKREATEGGWETGGERERGREGERERPEEDGSNTQGAEGGREGNGRTRRERSEKKKIAAGSQSELEECGREREAALVLKHSECSPAL